MPYMPPVGFSNKYTAAVYKILHMYPSCRIAGRAVVICGVLVCALNYRAPLKTPLFGLSANLSFHKFMVETPQYTKYSGVSTTFSGSKSSAEITKKEFLEVVYNLFFRCCSKTARLEAVPFHYFS